MALQYRLQQDSKNIELDDNGHPLVYDDQDEDEKAFGLDALHLY